MKPFTHFCLTLNSWGPEVTDAGVQSLGESLANLTSLQRISLNFQLIQNKESITYECRDGPGIADDGIKSLAKGLKNMTNLQSIFLDFL